MACECKSSWKANLLAKALLATQPTYKEGHCTIMMEAGLARAKHRPQGADRPAKSLDKGRSAVLVQPQVRTCSVVMFGGNWPKWAVMSSRRRDQSVLRTSMTPVFSPAQPGMGEAACKTL